MRVYLENLSRNGGNFKIKICNNTVNKALCLADY